MAVTNAPGRPNKIRTAGLEGVVRKLAGDGLGYREISDELKKRGHDIAYGAVGRFLSEEAGERREAARNVAAEVAHDTVPMVQHTLRAWVKDIATLVERTIEGVNSEIDPEAKSRKLDRAATSVSTLVNAGSKAAKLLHDITIGDGPTSPLEALQAEVNAILGNRRSESDDEEDDEED